MPLQHVDGEVILELAGISFAMLDGRTRVPVFVTYDAIEDIEQPRPSDHAELLIDTSSPSLDCHLATASSDHDKAQ